MSSDVKPKAGEWWESELGSRNYVVGCSACGTVVYYQYDSANPNCVNSETTLKWQNSQRKHLPSCTGWDCEPAKSHRCPEIGPCPYCTEETAAIFHDKPQPPAESPDDWVVLDPVEFADHIPRDGVDEFFNGRSWEVHGWKHCRTTVGGFARVSDKSRVRCRRRDLPAPAKRKVSVPMWLVSDCTGGQTVVISTVEPASYRAVEPAGVMEVEVPQ